MEASCFRCTLCFVVFLSLWGIEELSAQDEGSPFRLRHDSLVLDFQQVFLMDSLLQPAPIFDADPRQRKVDYKLGVRDTSILSNPDLFKVKADIKEIPSTLLTPYTNPVVSPDYNPNYDYHNLVPEKVFTDLTGNGTLSLSGLLFTLFPKTLSNILTLPSGKERRRSIMLSEWDKSAIIERTNHLMWLETLQEQEEVLGAGSEEEPVNEEDDQIDIP